MRAIIVLNKCDLVDLADLQPIIGQYARLGYTVVPTRKAFKRDWEFLWHAPAC